MVRCPLSIRYLNLRITLAISAAIWDSRDMFKKQNLPLIIGFALPILMIVFIAASVYIPGLFSQPKYNFLYAENTSFYDDRLFTVNDSHLTYTPLPTSTNQQYAPAPIPQLYIHKITTNESKPVSLDEAKKLSLDPSSESPDGYMIQSGNYGGSSFPFGSYDRDYNTSYIVGHNVSKKLNVKTIGAHYYGQVNFIGWIIK